MKRNWTRAEKWLWATPLIFVIAAGVAAWGPQVARRQLGRPIVLTATPAKSSSLRSIALSGDGALLAASCSESSNPKNPGGKILFWDMRTLKLLALGQSNGVDNLNNGNVRYNDNFAFVLAPDAKTVGFCRRVLFPNGKKQPFTLYDVATGKARWKLNGNDWSFAAHFSPDGQTLGVTRGVKDDVEIVFMRVADGTLIRRWTIPQVWFDATDFAWSPDGKTIVTVGSFPAPEEKYHGQMLKLKFRFEIRRADTGKIMRFWATRRVTNFNLAPDGRSLVAVTCDREGIMQKNFRAAVIDVATGRERWRFGGTENVPMSVRFSPDGTTIAVQVSYRKDWVAILDAQTGKLKRTLSTGGAPMNFVENATALAWAPDGKRLYARGKNAVLVWDLN